MKVERNRLGLKQSDVAAYLGIEVRSYQYYEAGRRRPDYEGLVALAVTTDYLLGRADTQK